MLRPRTKKRSERTRTRPHQAAGMSPASFLMTPAPAHKNSAGSLFKSGTHKTTDPGACTFQGLAGAGRCQWHARVGRASAPSSSTSGATVVWPRGRSNPTLTGSAILSPLALPRAVARSMGSARAGVAAHGFPAHYQGPDQDHMRVATRGATGAHGRRVTAETCV